MKLLNSLRQTTLFVVAALLVVACSARNKEYVNAIPADASMVVSFDVMTMIEKSGIISGELITARDLMLDELKGKDSEASKVMSKIIQNPVEAGLSFTDHVYLFMSSLDEMPVIVASVTDAGKLRVLFEALAKDDKCTSLTKSGKYSWCMIENELACAFNETTLIMVFVSYDTKKKDVKATLSKLMTQPSQKSINSNPGFDKMMNSGYDIGAYFTMEAVEHYYKKVYGVAMPTEIDVKESSIIGGVQFKKGELSFKAEYFTTNPESKRQIEEQFKIYGTPKNTFLSSFPAASFGYMGTSVDGGKLFDYISQRKEYQKIADEANKKLNVERVIKSFDGDMAFGFVGLSFFMAQPSMSLFAEVKDDYILNLIIENKEDIFSGKEVLELGDNKYSVSVSGLPIYFGMENNRLFFTTEKNVSENVSMKVENSLADNPIMTRAQDSYMYMMVNVEEILKNGIVQQALGRSRSDREVLEMLKQCSSMEVIATKEGAGEFNIFATNKEDNALKIIVRMIDDAVKRDKQRQKEWEEEYGYDEDEATIEEMVEETVAAEEIVVEAEEEDAVSKK